MVGALKILANARIFAFCLICCGSCAVDAFAQASSAPAAGPVKPAAGAPALPAGVNDVGLHLEAVADVGHIPDVDRRPVDGLDREVVDLGGVLRAGVQPHRIFLRADLGGARRQNEVLGIDGIEGGFDGMTLTDPDDPTKSYSFGIRPLLPGEDA